MSKIFGNNQKVWDARNKERTGLVIGRSAIAEDMIAVEWDEGDLERIHENDLLTEQDMKMELEFKAVNEKLQQAAILLREAAKSAEKFGKSLEEYDYNTDERYFPAIRDLMRAMDDAGWRTSSMNC